jgi:hypothetical protein
VARRARGGSRVPRGARAARRRAPPPHAPRRDRGAVHLLAQALIVLEEHRPARTGSTSTRLVADFGAFRAWLEQVDRPHRLLDRMRIPRLR